MKISLHHLYSNVVNDRENITTRWRVPSRSGDVGKAAQERGLADSVIADDNTSRIVSRFRIYVAWADPRRRQITYLMHLVDMRHAN